MKRKSIFYTLIYLCLAACGSIKTDDNSTELGTKFYFPLQSELFKKKVDDCVQKKEFPCNFPEPNDSLSNSTNHWYSKHLTSLKEPILYTQKGNNRITLRFTLLGTWSNPRSYRIDKYNSTIQGTYNRTNGQGGYEPGRRVEHVEKEISMEDWNKILAKVDSIDFWNIPTHDTNLVLDGSEWILEFLTNDQYHLVSRRSPGTYSGKDYAELCKMVQSMFLDESK